jgi:hypothetical protein
MIYGQIGYIPGIVMKTYSSDAGVNMAIESVDMTEKKTPEGFWLLLAIPYDNKSKQAKYLEDEIVGMFSLFFGQSYAYSKMFTNDFSYPKKEMQMYGPTIENPKLAHILPVNSITMKTFSFLLASLDSTDQLVNSTILSTLRWYKKATGEYGVEGFVFLWTALEIIGKNGSQNLVILKKKMMEKYKIDKVKFEQFFYIGHLESFRGKVLHQGIDKPIEGIILDYLRCIIEDLVIDALSDNHSHRAKEYIEENRKALIKAIDEY